MDEAWPGDVVGLVGHDDFGIGDTLTRGPRVRLRRDPALRAGVLRLPAQPEHGASSSSSARASSSCCRRAWSSAFQLPDAVQKIPLLAAVGPLQFEVVQYRLQSEYGAESRLENAPWECAKWLPAGTDAKSLRLPTDVRLAEDSSGRPALLFPNTWTQRYFGEINPGVALLDLPEAEGIGNQ